MGKPLFRVISCDQHVERRERFYASAAAAHLPKVTLQRGVDGRAMMPKHVSAMVRRGVIHKRATLTTIEVAISLSHRKCWQALVRSKASHMVVFEDDCTLSPDFHTQLLSILADGPRFDILHLVNGNWNQTRTWRERVGRVNALTIYRETLPHIPGTGCYVIHRDFAQVLLSLQLPIRYAVDGFIGYTRVKRHKHFTLETTKGEDGLYTISPVVEVYPAIIGSEWSTQRYDDAKVAEIIRQTQSL